MNTPCVGKSQLFDSTDPTDHAIAASLCRTCPVINECAQLLADAQATSPAGRECRPQGTWAGQLIGEPPTRRHAECGTDGGYYRHNRNGEAACEPCLKARREAERARAAKRRARLAS